jgi:isoquinoline 1-oxidoreductase subunit beta
VSHPNTARRDFLRAGAALVVAFTIPTRGARGAMQANASASGLAANSSAEPFAPNAWLRIGADDTITILVDRSEMGQGVYTSLPMLVAEELEADWSRIHTESAPADVVYANAAIGAPIQVTGGSTSIRAGWMLLRKAGATAREMLIDAAAQTWAVPRTECRAENGAIVHTSGKKATYGSLAAVAATLPVPKDPPLKDPKDYKLVGKPVHRLDAPSKCDGSAVFSLDVRLPGMKYAVVARSPVLGGKIKSVDDAKSKAMPGVRAVVTISSGVAVVADTTWQAMRGRDALVVTWDEGANAKTSSATLRRDMQALAEKPAVVARHDGDAEAVLAKSAKKIEAIYEAQYMAHATMEPMNCTADVRADGCDVYAPTQFQTGAQGVAAHVSGLTPDKVKIHTVLLGGGFGRRFELDFIQEAVEVSKAIGAPAKVVWSRADDMRHDQYRPGTYNKLAAALDKDGQPAALWARVVAPSVMVRMMPQMIQNGLDAASVEGLANIPYPIANVHVECAMLTGGPDVGFWRSVGNSQNGFVSESFVDELAHAAGADPFEFRRTLLKDHPRHRGVLEAAAKAASWGKPLPAGHAHGIAVLESFGSFAAHVAEVSVLADGTWRVHKVTSAIDPGIVVNPDTVRAQVESCVVWGLSMLKGQITFDKGRVQQSNFHDFQITRIDETPPIDVHIVLGGGEPGGIGEAGVGPLAPAVCNAIFAATGKRVRRLPILAADIAKS